MRALVLATLVLVAGCVAPGGEVIFRHNGSIDGDELRAKILAHMGRFYTPEMEKGKAP